MAQTKEGALKVVAKNLLKDPDYYKKLSKKAAGSRKNIYSYFAELKKIDPEKLKEIESKGGRVRKKKEK